MIEAFNSINNAVCGFLHINSYIQGVVVLMCINIIAILGMAVLTGFTRLFSFGNAGFMAIGAYAAAILIVRYHFNFLIAMVIGAALAGVVAFLLGSLTLKLKGDYFLITCLGFGECVRVLLNYFKKFSGGSAGFPGIPLKIVRPDLNLTLLDSLGKRVRFLEKVIETLDLNVSDGCGGSVQAAENPRSRDNVR